MVKRPKHGNTFYWDLDTIKQEWQYKDKNQKIHACVCVSEKNGKMAIISKFGINMSEERMHKSDKEGKKYIENLPISSFYWPT